MFDEARVACEAECAKHQKSFPDVQHLSAKELQQMLNNSALSAIQIVDVRSEGERNVSMLPGAICVNELRWPPEGGCATVFYCTVGYRSSLEARRFATSAPRDSVIYSMAGILDWAHQGGELVDASGAKVTRLHAFGSKWAAMAPTQYEVETFDARSCSFLRAVLRVAWLIGTWPIVGLQKRSRTGKAHEK